MQFKQIDIDVDVNRWIENKRTAFSQTPNDILRAVADLPAVSSRLSSTDVTTRVDTDPGAWSGKGITLPGGSRLRMSYNGKVLTGAIEGGAWVVQGARHASPSAAASAPTGVSLNGWLYWEVQFPGSSKWEPISDLRTHVERRRERFA